VSQGAIADRRRENLGTLDQGVTLFRRQLRRGIEAVQHGVDPPGVFRTPGPIPTYGNDRVIAASEMTGDPHDPAARRAYARAMGQDYLAHPPLQDWKGA
jgi:hypothetical protein